MPSQRSRSMGGDARSQTLEAAQGREALTSPGVSWTRWSSSRTVRIGNVGHLNVDGWKGRRSCERMPAVSWCHVRGSSSFTPESGERLGSHLHAVCAARLTRNGLLHLACLANTCSSLRTWLTYHLSCNKSPPRAGELAPLPLPSLLHSLSCHPLVLPLGFSPGCELTQNTDGTKYSGRGTVDTQ